MTSYNPKDWISFIFQLSKADTFRKLIPMMIIIGIYSGSIAYLEIVYWHLPEDSPVKNISVMHGMLGFVISLLLAYRTNTAYDRWWEGRKLWGGLVNSSRNLALKLAAILTQENDRVFFRKMIPGYATLLHKHLNDSDTAKELFDDIDLDIDHHKHRPNQVAKMLFQKVNDLYVLKKISGDQLLILNNELQSLTDICGACERIKNTPIPYSYSAFIKKFIFIYVLTLPFAYVFILGYIIFYINI